MKDNKGKNIRQFNVKKMTEINIIELIDLLQRLLINNKIKMSKFKEL